LTCCFISTSGFFLGIIATYLVFKELWKDNEYQRVRSNHYEDEDFFRLEEAQRHLKRQTDSSFSFQRESELLPLGYQRKSSKVSKLDSTLSSLSVKQQQHHDQQVE
jgi:hypothetical protein